MSRERGRLRLWLLLAVLAAIGYLVAATATHPANGSLILAGFAGYAAWRFATLNAQLELAEAWTGATR